MFLAGVALQDPASGVPKRLLWDSGVQVIEAQKVEPSKFYQLLLDEAEEDEGEEQAEDEEMVSPRNDDNDVRRSSARAILTGSPHQTFHVYVQVKCRKPCKMAKRKMHLRL